MGRWTSCDPSGINSGVNAFQYAASQPVLYVDLDGRDPVAPDTQKKPSTWATVKLLASASASFVALSAKTTAINVGVPARMLGFSHFTEVGPERQGFLVSVSPVPLPYKRPTVDPQTGATDYPGQALWDKGEAVGTIVQVTEAGVDAMGPPGPPGLSGPVPELASGGGAAAIPKVATLASPPLFAKSPDKSKETTAESDKRHEEETKQFEEAGGKKTVITGKVQIHHIASNKGDALRPGSSKTYADLFRDMFRAAGLGFDKSGNALIDPLNDAINLISIEDHEGPHGLDYNEAIFNRLSGAVKDLKPGTPEYREAFIKAFNEGGLRKDVSTKGTYLNDLATRR
jgi:hypothetical protein